MKEILLGNGEKTLVDDEDYKKFVNYLGVSWSKTSHGYVATKKMVNYRVTHFYLHRLVIDAKDGETVDHINRNRLDNRKSNLRICTQAQNCWNNDKKSKRSGYKGVWKDYGKRHGYSAVITVSGERTYLGHFDTKEKAALAYNEAAVNLKGEFAVLNVVH